MKGKTLVILLVICGALAWFGLKDEKREVGSNVINDKTPFKNLDINSLDQVKLKKDTLTVKLEKKSGAWRAMSGNLDYPLDFEKLREFLLSIKDMQLIDKKTSQEKHYKRFGLDDDSKPTKVELLAGEQQVLNLNLGKVRQGKKEPGPYSWAKEEGHYLTRGEDATVFLSKDKVNVDMEETFWMKDELVKVEKDEISKIEFTFPHKSYALDKSITKIEKSTDGSVPPEEKINWKASGDLPEAMSLKESEVKTLLDRLAELTVTKPVAKSKKAELSKLSPYALKVSRGENVLYELRVEEQKETWYVHLASQPDELYQMDNWRIEQIFAYSKNLFGLQNFKLSDKKVNSISWSGSSFSVKRDGDKWTTEGTAPIPEIKADELKKTIDLVKDIDLNDYHVKDIQPKPGKRVTFELEGGEKLNITEAGSLFLQDSKLILIEGKKGLFSISEATHQNLFPDIKKVLDLSMKPAAIDDLVEVSMPGIVLQKKGDEWVQQGRTEKVKKDEITTWFDGLKAIYDHPYASTGIPFKTHSTISLKSKDGKTLSLNFSDGDKGIALTSSSQFGGTFKVKWEVVKALFKPKDHFLEVKKADMIINNKEEKTN